jgi:2,3-bisphosphoglycerate-dependent phosphoglycerate mutase
VRLYVIARHAESTLNIERRINGDPAVDVPLTDDGREEARQLGIQIANLPLEVCVHTRFGRTLDTAAIALAGRDVPMAVEPLLDDIDVGDLEGGSIDDYRAWKRGHFRSDPFPGGESLDDAARRYARGFRALLALPAERVLVVCHEIPLRYALNAAGGSDDLDGPVHQLRNATPYLFDAPALERATARIEELVCGREDSNLQGPRGPAGPKPAASTSSATPAWDGSRIETGGKEPAMATQEDRERESRESDETKFDEAVERESEERERLGERVAGEELEAEED